MTISTHLLCEVHGCIGTHVHCIVESVFDVTRAHTRIEIVIGSGPFHKVLKIVHVAVDHVPYIPSYTCLALAVVNFAFVTRPGELWRHRVGYPIMCRKGTLYVSCRVPCKEH